MVTFGSVAMISKMLYCDGLWKKQARDLVAVTNPLSLIEGYECSNIYFGA